MGLQRYPYMDPTGGVNLRHGPLNLENNEAQSALNASITERGVVHQRLGKTAASSAGFPGGKRAEHMRNWIFGSSVFLVCSIDGDIYTMTSGGSLTQRFDGTAGKIWDFETAQDSGGNDRLWAMNGTDAPQKWDGAAGSSSAWANSPPNGTMLRVWKNRMCIAGVAANPQRLFFSDIGNPESPAAAYGTNWVDIKSTEDDLDPITWLDIVGDALLVFKKRSVWAVYDPTSFTNQRLGAPGCEDRFQSAELLGKCYYICRDGIYSVTPNAAPEIESYKIEPFFLDTVNHSQWSKCRMGVGRDRRIFAAFPTVGSTNDRLWEGMPMFRDDNGVMPWVPHSFEVASIANFRIGNEDILVAGAANTDKIHQLFNSLNDDGVAIDSHWFHSWKGLITEEPIERLRRLNIVHEGRAFVDVFTDLDDKNPKFSKLIETPVDPDPLWSGGPWDGGTWDPVAGVNFAQLHPETRGRYHAVKVRNNQLNATWKVHSTEMAFRGGKEHTR